MDMHFNSIEWLPASLCSYDGEDTGNGGFGGGPGGETAASDAASSASSSDASGPGVVDVGSWDVGPATATTASLGDLGNVALGGLGLAAGFMGGPAATAAALSALGVDVLNNGPVSTSAISVLDASQQGVAAQLGLDPAGFSQSLGMFGTSTSDASAIGGSDPTGGGSGGSIDWVNYWATNNNPQVFAGGGGEGGGVG